MREQYPRVPRFGRHGEQGQSCPAGFHAGSANHHRKRPQADILDAIFAGRNEGTLFLPSETRLCNRKHWITFTKAPKGSLVIDGGAERAILKQQRSLLPSGIVGVEGRFSVGNAVFLVNEKGEELAIGLVNYHSGDIKKIMGLKSRQIQEKLGFKYDDEVINRDNLVITNDGEGNGLCQLRA